MNPDSNPSVNPSPNANLKALQDQLLAQHQALYEQLDTTNDPAMSNSILTEMQEILHRVSLVQGLLLIQTTTALQASLQKVSDADAALTDALKEAQTAADIVNGVTKFLTVVDKAIDLAKKLAPMAVGL